MRYLIDENCPDRCEPTFKRPTAHRSATLAGARSWSTARASGTSTAEPAV